MQAIASPPTVKVIGANGQISLGKQFAGRQVLIEEQETGVWLIRTATVIPDNERWLHAATATKCQISSIENFRCAHPSSSVFALIEGKSMSHKKAPPELA